jgi:hypothetical protein
MAGAGLPPAAPGKNHAPVVRSKNHALVVRGKNHALVVMARPETARGVVLGRHLATARAGRPGHRRGIAREG